MKPITWKDVTIKQFNEYQAINESKTFEEEEKLIYLVSIFCGITTKEVEAMDITTFKECLSNITTLVQAEQPKTITSEVTIDGVLYKYNYMKPIHNAGQYIDLMVLGKKNNVPNMNFHKILAVFFLPPKQVEQSFTERCILFEKKMTMDIVFPMVAFFLNSYPVLMKATQDYMQNQVEKNLKIMQKMIAKEKKRIMRGGDGLTVFQRVLKRVAKIGQWLRSGK